MSWLNPWHTLRAFIDWRRRKKNNDQIESFLRWFEQRQRMREALKHVAGGGTE